ncbi:DNA/RNA non-specific endonuclease [Wenyingzhuangia sp. 2_MG-2023]|uniref:DNA/RNA non-specific endonuclease n=1 Tax=Wenyingzhuangia sp. 2_MG-2023 TaxID=3062639 RepID=UPI0026E1A2BC|nr:DNA/RNA non-specific endonuclease [Wenyingzhuangia sp. 2_MG-2023]MDO6738046.1 DNA/RNA non-specific endonuclease [Wenyingzhuangia sp. 2_MG-2023]
MTKRQKIVLYLIFAICIIIACSTLVQNKKTNRKIQVAKPVETEQPTNTTKANNNHFNYLTFAPSAKNKVYQYRYFTLEYNEEHEQASWVYYLLTSDFINGTAKRKDNFREDPNITTKSATLSDYKKSGYDRGHLCPAGDMKLNKTSMSETFYMSNMSPQLPGLNRGEWKRLESKVRKWAIEEDSLLIVTGPIFKNNLGYIGKEKVTIPGYYYKVIYDITPPQKMTAFILPHIQKLNPYFKYQTSVDKVEDMTGIDFFSFLNDDIEASLEVNIQWK